MGQKCQGPAPRSVHNARHCSGAATAVPSRGPGQATVGQNGHGVNDHVPLSVDGVLEADDDFERTDSCKHELVSRAVGVQLHDGDLVGRRNDIAPRRMTCW